MGGHDNLLAGDARQGGRESQNYAKRERSVEDHNVGFFGSMRIEIIGKS